LCGQRRKPKPRFDQTQDRDGLVLRMIDETLLCELGYNDGWNARAWAPFVTRRRRNVVPPAAILIVRHDDHGTLPNLSVRLNGSDDLGDMVLPANLVGVAGMLIVGPKRFDEGDSRQSIVRDIGKEILLILQMRGLGRGTVRIVLIVRKGL